MKFKLSNLRRTRGFTMVELIVVIAIVAVLAVLAVPAIRDMMINGAVEPTASDINKTVSRIRGNFAGQGATPYTQLGAPAQATATFANTARGLSSSMTAKGTATTATLQHSLGASGATVTVASATITAAGDAFAVTVNDVHNAACPGLASQLSKSAEVISINGTTVKANGGSYNGGTATNACTTGETNDFVFTFR